MPYQATVIPIMIASPGDVLEERNVTRDIIHEWNYVNSISTNAVLLPVGWETHSARRVLAVALHEEIGGAPDVDVSNTHWLDASIKSQPS